MLNEQTEEKLKAMRLGGMLEAWSAQRTTPNAEELGFDERFGLLVDAEEAHRENKRFQRALNEAKLKISQACVEGIDYPPKRTLDKAVIRQLASCRWITEAHHISVTGATGTGKTYVACALAHQACRKGYRAIYRKMSRLFQELRLARADGTYPRVLARLARLNVLVIDDFGIAPLSDQERQDLLEVLDDRYDTGSVIIAGQLPPTAWHEYIGDPTLADAICDRILHRCHKTPLEGSFPPKGKSQRGLRNQPSVASLRPFRPTGDRDAPKPAIVMPRRAIAMSEMPTERASMASRDAADAKALVEQAQRRGS